MFVGSYVTRRYFVFEFKDVSFVSPCMERQGSTNMNRGAFARTLSADHTGMPPKLLPVDSIRIETSLRPPSSPWEPLSEVEPIVDETGSIEFHSSNTSTADLEAPGSDLPSTPLGKRKRESSYSPVGRMLEVVMYR